MKDLIFEGIVDEPRVKEACQCVGTFNEKSIVLGEGHSALLYAPNSLFMRNVDHNHVDKGIKMTVYLEYDVSSHSWRRPSDGKEFPMYKTTDFSDLLEGLEGREV